MSTTLTVRDEELSGAPIREFTLELESERITVQELIRSRVYQEVKDYNIQQNQAPFQGLIRPIETEESLHGTQPGQKRQIDWKAQYDKAIEAFKNKQILVLIDNRQAGTLDENVELSSSTVVSFLRLTMLAGG